MGEHRADRCDHTNRDEKKHQRIYPKHYPYHPAKQADVVSDGPIFGMGRIRAAVNETDKMFDRLRLQVEQLPNAVPHAAKEE